jgi:hypothetical protein
MIKNEKKELEDLMNLPYTPGIDPGLREWAKVRQALRNAKENGSVKETIPQSIRFLRRNYWEDEALRRIKNCVNTSKREEDDLSIDNESKSGNETMLILQNYSPEEAKEILLKKSRLKAKQKAEKIDKWWDSGTGNGDEIHDESWIKTSDYNISEFRTAVLSKQISEEEILIECYLQRHYRFFEIAIYFANINVNIIVDDKRQTLLAWACKEGDFEKVKYLITAGANIKVKNKFDQTILHLALNKVRWFHPLTLIEYIIKLGVDINAKDNRGQTALHRACVLEDLDLIEILLQRNASVNILDSKQQFAIQYSRKVSRIYIIKLIINIIIFFKILLFLENR